MNCNGDTLKSLMEGYQRADQDAAGGLIDCVGPSLHRFFMAQYVSRRYADDLLQETWLRVHQARHTYRLGEAVLPWIYAIARNVRVDSYRKARRIETREHQVELLPEPALQVPRPERGPDLATLLKALPESQREVITLLKIAGLSLEEVARSTSSSVGSVKQKAHRAYEKLRELLGGKGGSLE